MELSRRILRVGVDAVLRVPAAERRVLEGAGRRGRGLAFVWHRIGPGGPEPDETVRTVALAAFEAQLDLLSSLGDIVPLADLERAVSAARPRFALTFDDDDPGHTRYTLPALRRRGMPATFFLSGRWRLDDGPYRWEVVEQLVRRDGLAAVAARCGVTDADTPGHLVERLTGTVGAASFAAERCPGDRVRMTAVDAAELVAAGMEVGFHTRNHDLLPRLGDARAVSALSEGRAELERELGVSLERFAYPHGAADVRVAMLCRRTGYRSAWTTAKRVVRPGEDPLLLGRWDLGHRPLREFRARVVRALARGRP